MKSGTIEYWKKISKQYDFSNTKLKDPDSLAGNLRAHEWPGIKPYVYLLTGLTIAMRPKLTFEIGTGGLLSARSFLYALEKIGNGELVSCDPAKRFGNFSHPQFTFINKPSYEIAKTWKQAIDVLFLDGSHIYEDVKRDYILFSPFVRRSGLILLHDWRLGNTGVGGFVRTLKIPKIFFDQFPGLVIVQKVR